MHASKGKKQFTVFVLTHLVEDIHQPLHAVWDTSLVERLYGGQNEITVAKRLVQKYAPRAGEWQAGRIDLAKIQAWVEESTPLPRR